MASSMAAPYTKLMHTLRRPRLAPATVTLALRSFHTTPSVRSSSPFFHLSALSNSRETRHFAKTSGLSRIEHSPQLQLLKSEAQLAGAKLGPPTAAGDKAAAPARGPLKPASAADAAPVTPPPAAAQSSPAGQAPLHPRNTSQLTAEVAQLRRALASQAEQLAIIQRHAIQQRKISQDSGRSMSGPQFLALLLLIVTMTTAVQVLLVTPEYGRLKTSVKDLEEEHGIAVEWMHEHDEQLLMLETMVAQRRPEKARRKAKPHKPRSQGDAGLWSRFGFWSS